MKAIDRTAATYFLMFENCRRYCDLHCKAGGSRCCVRKSCEIVYWTECGEETRKLFDKDRRIPFLGKDGCVVPPHERKYCTTFICDQFATSKHFKRHLQLVNMLPIRDKVRFKKRLHRLIDFQKKIEGKL